MYSSWVAACDPSSSVQWPYQLCEGHHVVSSNPTLVTWGLYWLHHTLLMKQNHHWASGTSSDKDTVPSDSSVALLVFYCSLWLCMVFWGFLNFGPSKSWLERKDEPNKRWRKRMEMEKASGQANKRKGLQTHQSADRQTNIAANKKGFPSSMLQPSRYYGSFRFRDYQKNIKLTTVTHHPLKKNSPKFQLQWFPRPVLQPLFDIASA